MSARRSDEDLPRRNYTLRLADAENAPIEALAVEEGRSWADMTRRLLVEAITARGKQTTDKENP